jgi:PAS domain S-box-containing protein
MDDQRISKGDGDYGRLTSDAVPALISFFDAQHVCRYANDHHVLWYGREPKDLVGLHMREFLGADAYDTRLSHLARVERGEQVSFEAAVPHRDGGWRDAAVRYVPRMGPEGFEGFHTLVFDLSREQHRYHSVFDGMAVGFWEIDLSNLRDYVAGLGNSVADVRGHIAQDLSSIRHVLSITPVLDLNEKACRMLATSRGAAIGRPLGDWCPEEGLPAWNRTLLAYLDGDESYEAETVMRRDDGELVDVLLSCAFPRKRDEQVIVVVGLVDISARIAKEKELARSHTDLAHAARVSMLGELMASIAHEVNQPLAAVMANGNAALRWLNRAEPDIGEARAAIQRIMSEGTRASEIIARTRQLAMKGTATRSEFDVNEMIEESIDITRRQTSALGAVLTTKLAPHMPPLLADRVQMQQVVINLVVNAAQAMAGQEGVRSITVGTSSTDGRVVIEVADSGPGFGEHSDRIFDAFYTTKSDGMGMGLSVAKSIIEAHDGRIAAGACPGGGTRFHLAVPVPGSASEGS